MLCTLNDILLHARKNKYAVPAFDTYSDIFTRCIITAADEVRSPVILMAIPHGSDNAGEMLWLAETVKGIAPKYELPIALHLDHASSFQQCEDAIKLGFSSVMFDGSHLSFEDNIKETKAVVDLARRYGVSTEAELGFVAGVDIKGNDTGETRLTDPYEVEEFVAKTGVDALAVSIGTAHGVYESQPNLDIEQLKKIDEVSTVPLVLHGGSGTPLDQVQNAIAHGIAKINIFADMRQALGSAMAEVNEISLKRCDPLLEELLAPIEKALVAQAKAKMIDFFAAGKI